MKLSLETVPPPDRAAEPEGYVVLLDRDRIHFLDWGGPTDAFGVLLIHGLGATAWAWSPVARRLRALRHVVAMDLRGHGLSDAPTSGFEPEQLVADAIAVAEGSGLLAIDLGDGPAPGSPPRRADGRVILAGHGYGAMVAAWAAAALGYRCAALVLVDGGWEDLRETTGIEPDEWLRGLDEPPEVMRSMAAYLAERAAFDPTTWDADQERAARATVTEVPAGHLLPSLRPHALALSVEAMFAYRPSVTLPSIEAPIGVLVGADDEEGTRMRALHAARAALVQAGRPPLRVTLWPGLGHNLMRYRPVEVTAAILSATTG